VFRAGARKVDITSSLGGYLGCAGLFPSRASRFPPGRNRGRLVAARSVIVPVAACKALVALTLTILPPGPDFPLSVWPETGEAWNSHAIPRYRRAKTRVTMADARVQVWSRTNIGSRRCTATDPTRRLLASHIPQARLLTAAEHRSRARWITWGTYAATEITIPATPRIPNTVFPFLREPRPR